MMSKDQSGGAIEFGRPLPTGFPPFGNQMMSTPAGPVRTADAPALMTTVIFNLEGDRNERLGLVLYDNAPIGRPHGVAMVYQAAPHDAYRIAGSIIRRAREIDTAPAPLDLVSALKGSHDALQLAKNGLLSRERAQATIEIARKALEHAGETLD